MVSESKHWSGLRKMNLCRWSNHLIWWQNIFVDMPRWDIFLMKLYKKVMFATWAQNQPRRPSQNKSELWTGGEQSSPRKRTDVPHQTPRSGWVWTWWPGWMWRQVQASTGLANQEIKGVLAGVCLWKCGHGSLQYSRVIALAWLSEPQGHVSESWMKCVRMGWSLQANLVKQNLKWEVSSESENHFK